MLVGYARVSTLDQKMDLQIDALKEAGCEKIFTDQCSGAKAQRPGLDEALEFIRKDDCLVIWKLDRLGRSLKHLVDTLEMLKDRGIGFKSIRDGFDTTTAAGMFLFNVMGAMAEFEREIIRERVNAGLTAARARGVKGGRKPVLNSTQIKLGVALAKNREIEIAEICEQLKCSRSTYYRQIAPLLK